MSPRLFALFAAYARSYLRRHFHAVRRLGPVPRVAADAALVVYCNHPSWWDPLLILHLASSLYPGRTHYGPIDAAALDRYAFFRHLGFFGVRPGVAGARRFLHTAETLLARPGTALWITPEGRFTDPRQRPVHLRPGLARLAARWESGVVEAGAVEAGAVEVGAERSGGGEGTRPGGRVTARRRRVVFLPVAIEYSFWEERFPEALLHFGEPVEAGFVARSATAGGADREEAAKAETTGGAEDRLMEHWPVTSRAGTGYAVMEPAATERAPVGEAAVEKAAAGRAATGGAVAGHAGTAGVGEERAAASAAGNGGVGAAARRWAGVLSKRLGAAQDALARAAVAHDPAAFEVLLSGRAGVGGVYDLWRAAKARLRGERFRREHGEVAE